IEKYQGIPVFHLRTPEKWDARGVKIAAEEQLKVLGRVRSTFGPDDGSMNSAMIWPENRTHPAENRLLQRDRMAIWHPYTSLRDPDRPLACIGAQDEFLFLADGRKIIDAISSWWTILHGHRHPVLLTALNEAARSFDHVHFAGVTHAPAVELAELML